MQLYSKKATEKLFAKPKKIKPKYTHHNSKDFPNATNWNSILTQINKKLTPMDTRKTEKIKIMTKEKNIKQQTERQDIEQHFYELLFDKNVFK